MERKIIISGFGGQGIIALGKFIALTAMMSDKNVTYLPSYGAEVRGGTANCQVVVSDGYIASPCIEEADILLAMNRPSLNKFAKAVKQGGLILANSSLGADRTGDTGKNAGNIYNIPATDMAVKLGEIKVANVIALGALLSIEEFLPVSMIKENFSIVLKHKGKGIIALNLKALDCGLRFKFDGTKA
ncbi:2-oxoacid:acceptor oxidoreductase family protein [bacterium]|jgi:2-oxoglutarate ferredoxin oxidoreductase subunit gamma|nr:2-oxoacid:acceptor oxidoreductase family protein [bacterium]